MEHAPSWLTSSLVYLAAAVAAVPLSKALGLGSIIGYLVAGIVIGPWVLALVRDPSDVLHFAEFGVVLMLFLVGLELEPKRLWAMRRPIFGWGSAQVAVCAGALVAAAMAFGIDWRVALAASLGLALSSTAIALQVMDERGIAKTTSGRSAFAILLFQDVAAIPILALVPLLGAQVDHAAAEPWWQQVVRIVGVIALVVLGGRLAVRPALRWIARSRTPEVFTAASLLIVVAIAAAMQRVGMSMALGAFLAGVLLAESEYKHELEADIAPFKGLLLGLFFMAVGMSIDFGALAQQPWLLLGVLGVFLAVKTMVIALLARAMGMPAADRPIFTLLLAQGGEFAFVVFQAAAGAKVFGNDVASLLIGAVALSMLATPLLVVAVDRWLLPHHARYAAANGKPAMEELSQPQSAPVIVAGFGRFGQMVSRLLLANGIQPSVLDHDAERIDSARAFGYRVFYGDATRADLLVLAGAEQAKVIVVAVDGQQAVNAIVDLARERFAQAKLVVRVRDLTHGFEMLDRGVVDFEREVFEGSLATGRRVLDALGYAGADADAMVRRFRAHNLELMHAAHRVRHDRTQLIALNKRARSDLEAQMAQEQAERQALRSHADATADAFGLPKAG